LVLPLSTYQYEIDNGQREGLTTSEREELQRLRREIRILLPNRHEIGSNAFSQLSSQKSLENICFSLVTFTTPSSHTP
jgi:hypothetical protein